MSLRIPPAGYSTAQLVTVSASTAVAGSTASPTTSSTDYCVRIFLVGAAAASVFTRVVDQTTGHDLTVWWYNGTTWVQLDTDVETLTSGTISLWFKLQAAIGASSSDSTYLLAYGNGSPVVKQNWSNIYPLQDDFLGSSLDATKWLAFNGAIVTVAGSILTIGYGNPSNGHGTPVHSLATFGPGYAIRAKGAMPYADVGHTDLYWYNGDSDEAPPGHQRWLTGIFASYDYYLINPTNYMLFTFNDDFGSVITAASPPLIPFSNASHVWNLGRDSSGVGYAWVDEGPVTNTTTAPNTNQVYAYMAPWGNNMGASNVQQTWDFVKVRPYVVAEPAVSLGLPVFFPPPALAWPLA